MNRHQFPPPTPISALEFSTARPVAAHKSDRMTVKPKPLSRPWWNYVRFSLRALIVLVLLIGAGLGWLVRSAHVQRDAVAAIRRAGGSVSYDWEWNNGKSVPGGKPWAPKWLVDLVGIDYYAGTEYSQ